MKTVLTVLGVGIGGYLAYLLYKQYVAAQPLAANAPLTAAAVTASDRTALLAQGWTVASNGSLLPPLPAVPTLTLSGGSFLR